MTFFDDVLRLGEENPNRIVLYPDFDQDGFGRDGDNGYIGHQSILTSTSTASPGETTATENADTPDGGSSSPGSPIAPDGGLVKGTNGRWYCRPQVTAYLQAWGAKRIARYINRNMAANPPPGARCCCFRH
eukprot:TRINITY_DN4393_c0_g2_i1.p1 TRINITY_DN4393_c0_g2~~TRINITY_DN4393_c0_g2_i1.p1  ORF type:complete len:131 (+),score=22.01 TRINITY_DN4393_c0_g2_i1:107-499(+)